MMKKIKISLIQFWVTDRIVVDRQLQDAIRSIEHQPGVIKVMDDKATSSDLADALAGNTKLLRPLSISCTNK